MGKDIITIEESRLKAIVAEGVKRAIKMLKESAADDWLDYQMSMNDRYEEDALYKELGGQQEVEHWAKRGWLSPKQQVFYRYGFLKDVHRKPTVPLLNDEELNAAIAKAEKDLAAYEKDPAVKPEKVKAMQYLYNCLMDQRNNPEAYEKAKSAKFYKDEKDAIDMQHLQAEREYDSRNVGMRDVGPEKRRSIMNNNPGKNRNQPKKPEKNWFSQEMRQGEHEMKQGMNKGPWFPNNFKDDEESTE